MDKKFTIRLYKSSKAYSDRTDHIEIPIDDLEKGIKCFESLDEHLPFIELCYDDEIIVCT